MELLEEVDLSKNEITTLDMAFIPQSVKKDRTKLFEWTGVDSKVNSPEFKVQIQRPPTFNRSFISRTDHFGAGFFSDQWLEKLFLKLSLAYNKLTDLSFFASNTQLEELNLIGNQILTFPTLNLPNLRILKMCHNALISMGNDPFSQLTSLEQFRIGHKSHEYWVAWCIITNISCTKCHLGLIPAFKEIKNYPSTLKRLYLKYDNITEILPDQLPSSLEVLDLSGNDITEFNAQENSKFFNFLSF